MKAFHEEQYRGFTIELVPDQYPDDPRETMDFISTWICSHRHHDLGDDNHGYFPDSFSSWSGLKEQIAQDHGERSVILSLYLLDHSGLRLRANRGFEDCDPHGWDWGMVGFAIVSEEVIREEYGDLSDESIARVKKVALAEVQTVDDSLSGYVYGYVVRNGAGDTVDSLWGFHGDADKEYALEEARNRVDYLLDKKKIDGVQVETWQRWVCPICDARNEFPGNLDAGVVECASCLQIIKVLEVENG